MKGDFIMANTTAPKGTKTTIISSKRSSKAAPVNRSNQRPAKKAA
jgi:hypothetical protein